MVNQLPPLKRSRILYLLLEGNSMRGICRMEEVSWRTVEKLLNDAAKAGRRYQRKALQGHVVTSIQCDELWSFCYAKQRQLKQLPSHPDTAGDIYTWVALEPNTKLVLAYRVGGRGDHDCRRFLKELANRIDFDDDLEIFTDGHAPYVKAIKRYFGTRVSYGQLIKTHTADDLDIKQRTVFGGHVIDKVSTSYIERFNLTVRQHVRRYGRKTNGFSKTIENHKATVDLFMFYYNFIRYHETLKTTPAVAAGLISEPYSFERLVRRINRMHRRERERRPTEFRLLLL